MNTHTLYEPTREQLQTEGILVAQRAKWDGWNWKEYQTSIVRQNHALSRLTAQRDELLKACKAAQSIVESAYLDDVEAGEEHAANYCFCVNEQVNEAIAKVEANQ